MAPECLRRTQLFEVGWQSIPHSWSGDTECSVSELLNIIIIIITHLLHENKSQVLIIMINRIITLVEALTEAPLSSRNLIMLI